MHSMCMIGLNNADGAIIFVNGVKMEENIMLTFICYQKCSTCQKARAFLDRSGVKYEVRDIKANNPTYEELKHWLTLSGLPVRKFFNTSGMLYKSLNLKEKLPDMSGDECLKLLATDGMLVKRPLLIGEHQVLVGFKQPEWESTLKENERITLVKGDITKVEADCIVNAANSSLLGGGGVDGAIHRAAGPELLQECKLLGGCKTGQAKITKGYRLPAKHIIHTVGPVYEDGRRNEPGLLADCYRNSLELAVGAGIRTIAFPCISTGVYRYPFEDACRIALQTIRAFLAESSGIEQVLLVCFSQSDHDRYAELMLE